MNSQGRVGSLVGIFAAVVLFAIFTASAIWVLEAIAGNSADQRLLRTAQVERARLLRLQLDEETAIRGYVATVKPQFLPTYYNARRRFGETATRLTKTLDALSIDDRIVREERVVNAEWLAKVATPSLRNPRSSIFLVQLTSKSLVDGFRNLDAQLFTRLTTRSEAADKSATDLITRLLVGSLVLGAVLALVFAAIATAGFRVAAKLQEQRKAFEDEKRVADALQQAFLGRDLPKLPDAVLSGVYAPAGREAKVGGDWYDAFALPDDRILFSIGDVAGHGVEAAVVMSRARQSILTAGIEESDPGAVLARTNRVLRMQDVTMVTAACGFIDTRSGTIAYASAGHPPIVVLLQTREIRQLATGGPPLGIAGSNSYASFQTTIAPQSMLVLYTDGLVEYARDWDAGERRLLEAIRRLDRNGPSPAAALLEAIFRGKAPVDDVAILTICFRSVPHDVRSWKILAIEACVMRRTRAEFSAALRTAQRSDEEVEIGTMILGELLANACEHGELPVEVELLESRGKFTLVVTDAGRGIARPRFRDPTSLRGRGLAIVEALGGAITLSHKPLSRVAVRLPFGSR
ncbi:MAG: SpoIIE family protein phosphatase [Candidatus Baltobacteraceae bacterium]